MPVESAGSHNSPVMDAAIRRTIEGIHASPAMAVITAAGAGGRAVTWLLQVPGASRTILEITVPYASAALEDYLAFSPKQVVSEEVALEMSRRAFERASQLADAAPTIGIGATATISTDRPKRGQHRCYVASRSARGQSGYGVTLEKGLRGRTVEDGIVSRLIIRLLAEECGVSFDAELGLLPSELLETLPSEPRAPLRELLGGALQCVAVDRNGTPSAAASSHRALLSGSFDPLHDGHLALARTASQMLGVETAFELSVLNVDKPPLGEDEISRRLRQFEGVSDVALTRAPTFVEKARILPNVTFVIGRDTAERLFDPRYYGGSPEGMRRALSEIRERGCRFLVAGRLDGGRFRSAEEIEAPPVFADMLTPIPESRFRLDISSTAIREAAAP